MGSLAHHGYVGDLYIDLASDTEGHLNISVPFLNEHVTQPLYQGRTTLYLGRNLTIPGTFIENRGIHLTTSVPVSVYVTNYISNTFATYLAFPLNTLGNTYQILSSKTRFNIGSEFMVIGVHDFTQVRVTYVNGTVNTKVIHRLVCYQEFQSIDMTGTQIETDKPVTVLSGTDCASFDGFDCNMLMVQLHPVKLWDSAYIAPSFHIDNITIVQVRVTTANESIQIDIKHSATGETSQLSSDINLVKEEVANNTASLIASNQPFQVGVYSGSSEMSLTVLPGIHQYLNDYHLVMPVYTTYIQNHYIVVIISRVYLEKDGSSGIVVDGQVMSSPVVSYRGPDPFQLFIYRVTNGYHHIRHTNNAEFGLLCVGVGPNIVYTFPGGIRFNEEGTYVLKQRKETMVHPIIPTIIRTDILY